MYDCELSVVPGTCRGLFTNTELIRIQNTLRRDGLRKSVTPQTIARLVQRNLHVIIAWDVDRTTQSPISSRNGTDPGLEEVTQDMFSMLCSKCSVVDHYETWGEREFCEVAQRWWRDKIHSLQQGWITSG